MADRIASLLTSSGWLSVYKSDDPHSLSSPSCAEALLQNLEAEVRKIEWKDRFHDRIAALAVLEALEEKRGGSKRKLPRELPLAAFAGPDFAALLISKLKQDDVLLTRAFRVAGLMTKSRALCREVFGDGDTWSELSTALIDSSYNPDLLQALSNWVEHVIETPRVATVIAQAFLIRRPVPLLGCLSGEYGSPEAIPHACRIFKLVYSETDPSQLGFHAPLDALCGGARVWHRRARCSLQLQPVIEACVAAAEACVGAVAAMALRRRVCDEPLRAVVPALLHLLGELLIADGAEATSPCARKRDPDDRTEPHSSAVVPCAVCEEPGSATSERAVASSARTLQISWAERRATPTGPAAAPHAAASPSDAATAAKMSGPDIKRDKPMSVPTSKLCARIASSLLELFVTGDGHGASMQKQALQCGAGALLSRLLISGDDAASVAASKVLSFLVAVARHPPAYLLHNTFVMTAVIDRLIQMICSPACSIADAEYHAALLEKLLMFSAEQRARIGEKVACGSTAGASALKCPSPAEQLMEAVARFAVAPEFAVPSAALAPTNLTKQANSWRVNGWQFEAIVLRGFRLAGAAAQAAVAITEACTTGGGALMGGSMTRGSSTWESAKRALDLSLRLARVQRDWRGPGSRHSDAAEPLAVLWHAVVLCQPADVLTATIAELGLPAAFKVLQHMVSVAANVHDRISMDLFAEAASVRSIQ